MSPLLKSMSRWLFVPALVGLFSLISVLPSWADSGRLVVVTTPWCASCREVMPGLRTLAEQKGYTVQEVNAEDENAQATCRPLGITISGSSLPQIYKVQQGRTQLLMDGKGYQLGHPERVIQTVAPQL